jgi:hypothetical protein
MIAIGDKLTNRWRLQIANRWVVQYNFYINDRNWGRMFIRWLGGFGSPRADHRALPTV